MSVAENILKYRKARKMSQEALAARSGVSQSAISAIEKGDRAPSETTIVLLAEALRVPVSELFGENEKAAASDGDGLKAEISNLLLGLSDEELHHMLEYAEFLKSRRGKP